MGDDGLGNTCIDDCSDRELARCVDGGDKGACSELAKRYMPLIRTICRFRIRDAFCASETANDILAEVYRCIGKYANGRGKLSTWIGRVAHNCCSDAIQGLGEDDISLDDLSREKNTDPHLIHYDRAHDRADTARDVRMDRAHHALASLSDREQFAVRLRLLGHSFLEVGTAMAITRIAAKQLYWRAVQRMKNICGVSRCHLRYDVTRNGYVEE